MPLAVVTLVLNYRCGACGQPVAATLRCEGDIDRRRPLRATVGLSCPDAACGRISDVTFDQYGLVHAVAARTRRPGHEPVWN